ncbi:MAG: hypothetical protein NT159_18595 [Proteobacteria bacterium]|nr:hypothetical protein [Pseudomonadota bacterium]
MPYTHKHLRNITALLLCLAATGARAGDDWLIARVNGLWTWERSGPEGRVHKKFLNQEVVRLGEKGAVVVISLQPIEAGRTVQCSERARHDPQEACSSAFLDCKPAGGGVFSAVLGLVINGSKGISDARNAYRCSVNEDAVLEAAHAVGLIEGIPPKATEQSMEPLATPNKTTTPYDPW